jgi:hypothetical protein
MILNELRKIKFNNNLLNKNLIFHTRYKLFLMPILSNFDFIQTFSKNLLDINFSSLFLKRFSKKKIRTNLLKTFFSQILKKIWLKIKLAL